MKQAENTTLATALFGVVVRCADALGLIDPMVEHTGDGKAEGHPMNAIDLILHQHRLVISLFEKLEAADDHEKPEIFDEIASNLVAHDAMEREIFYPACEKAIDEEDVLGESLVEHGLVEFSIFRADQHRGKKYFDEYATVLQEVVQHHVDEEQKDLLPQAKKVIDEEKLEALGARMKTRFDQAMVADFRKPLQDALRQVLAGRTKTVKKSAARTSRAKMPTKMPKKMNAKAHAKPARRSAAKRRSR